MEAGSGLNTYLHSIPFFSWVKLRLGRRNILPKVTAAGGRQKHLNPILPGSKAVLLKTTCYSHPAQPAHLCWKPSRVLGTIQYLSKGKSDEELGEHFEREKEIIKQANTKLS